MVHQSHKPPQLSNKHLIMLIKFSTHGKHLAEGIHPSLQPSAFHECMESTWIHFPHFCSHLSLVWATLFLPLRLNPSPPPTSPLLQVLKQLLVFIFTFSFKLAVFNAGTFLRPSSPPQWHCASMSSCSAQKMASLQFFCQQQLSFNFQVQLIRRKKIPSFHPCQILCFPCLSYSLYHGIYSMTFKVHGFDFSTTDPKQIQKNPIYFFIIYVSVLGQTSKEHSRNLSRWLLEVFLFD